MAMADIGGMNSIGLEACLDRALLELAYPDDLTSVLDVLVSLTGARFAYVEAGKLSNGSSHSGRDTAALGAMIPRDLIRRARLGAPTAGSTGAAADRVEAVLCIPITPVGGVLCLQGSKPFDATARTHALRVARRIAERVLLGTNEVEPVGLHAAMREFQRRHVLAALERNQWNVADAARELKVARSYMYRLIALHALQRELH